MMMPSIFRENLWNDWMDFSFPELDGKMQLALPDEYFRRVGQSAVAASLAEIK